MRYTHTFCTIPSPLVYGLSILPASPSTSPMLLSLSSSLPFLSNLCFLLSWSCCIIENMTFFKNLTSTGFSLHIHSHGLWPSPLGSCSPKPQPSLSRNLSYTFTVTCLTLPTCKPLLMSAPCMSLLPSLLKSFSHINALWNASSKMP